MFRIAYFVACAAAAAALVPAQTNNHLIGLTRILGNVRHQSHSTCSVLGTCGPAGFPSAAGLPASAGGAAWDPVHSGAWITNGQFLALVDDTCNYLCAPMAVPGIGGGTVIVGLEVVESRNELWLVDSAGMLRTMTLTCPPMPVSSCAVAYFDPSYTTTGLAVDELNRIVFFSRVNSLGLIQQVVAYSDLATPCAIINGFGVAPCQPAAGLFTGLACDAAARRLYATDGLRTVSIDYQIIGGLPIGGPSICCPLVPAGPDPMIGLALRPGHATSSGPVCASGACPACPMTHRLRGDPVLGNGQFALELGDAPAGSLAWCIVGIGPCAAPGVFVAPLCGPIYTGPVLNAIGFVAVGGAGCAGTASFPLGLPPTVGFAGMVLSSQCVVMCAAVAGFGTSVSNCLSFELQGV